MANTDEIEILFFSDEHLKNVQTIIHKTFQKKVPLEKLKNKYTTKHLPLSNISTIAFYQGKAIAFYGAIVQVFNSKNEKILVAHACDSFTLPEFQKRGLHQKLALKAYERMKCLNIKMVYAFHSENTFYSTKKLDWKEGFRMQRFHIKNNQIPIAKLLNKIGLVSIVQNRAAKVLNPFIIKTNELKKKENIKLKQNYDQGFFDYKESFNQHFLICLNQCHFYLKVGAIMHIGFFEYESLEFLRKALNHLKTIAFKMGIREILFQLDPNSSHFAAMSKLTKPKPSWLVGYLSFSEEFNIDQFEFNYGDLDTF